MPGPMSARAPASATCRSAARSSLAAPAPTWNATTSSACWRYDFPMRLADPVAAAWKASLSLGFTSHGTRSVLSRREHDGPLVVQKALYPEGEGVCHAIVVHPPGGIVGGDQLGLRVDCAAQSHALLTTPGAGKWYRSAGAWARQSLDFSVAGTLEWLPRETIVFDGALAELTTTVDLAEGARFIGWEVVCLGRRGAGERFERGRLRLSTRIDSAGLTAVLDPGEIEAERRPLHLPLRPCALQL